MLITQLSILNKKAMIDIELKYVPRLYVGAFMSNTNNTQNAKSDITKAIEKVEAEQIDKNLHQEDRAAEKPQDLTDAEKTPFIDEQQRTDK